MGDVPLVALHHDDFGAPGSTGMNLHLIHERFHQENTSARISEHIFVVPGIGDILEPESRSLVHHMDYQHFIQQLKGDVNLPFAPLLVAILESVHNAFVDREANLVLIVFAESNCRGDTHGHVFGESNALDQRFQDDFNPLRF